MTLDSKNKIQLALISGISGAGKTTLAHVCEEKGFYVVEDLPAEMIPALLGVFKSQPELYAKVALIVNIANAEKAITLVKADSTFESKTIGLDCSFDSLMNRFRLTRHIHPLQPRGYTLEEALQKDAELMKVVRPDFDVYLDTSGLTEKALRKIASGLLWSSTSDKITVNFTSFGYKYGLPRDAEIVIDARVLANPYWVPSLSRLTGLDQPVIDYIDKDPKTKPFMDSLIDLLNRYILSAIDESRNFVFVDIGCSGGQHRSVYVAEHLYEYFSKTYKCLVTHREISRYREDEKD